MRKLIKVTRKHIKNGKRNSWWDCPVSLALKDSFETNIVKVALDFSNYVIDKSGNKLVGNLSKRVIQLMKRFDTGKRIEPFNFYFTWAQPKVCHIKRG